MTPTNRLRRVISGFQTGADQAGVRAAKRRGYATGGMMPKGWKTEAGPRPEFAEIYGAIESKHEGYEHRTRWNVQRSNATIIFARTREDGSIIDGGSYRTKLTCTAMNKQWLCLDLARMSSGVSDYVHLEIARNFLTQFEIVNVAGNAESRAPGLGELVERFLIDVLPPYDPAIVAAAENPSQSTTEGA